MEAVETFKKAKNAFGSSISIDNFSFKCHYQVSSVILVLLSVVLTSRQTFGSPIHCDAVSNYFIYYIGPNHLDLVDAKASCDSLHFTKKMTKNFVDERVQL
jgi:hypothetical protein